MKKKSNTILVGTSETPAEKSRRLGVPLVSQPGEARPVAVCDKCGQEVPSDGRIVCDVQDCPVILRK